MKEKKKITLGTVVATSIGAIFWIIVSCCYFEKLANTTALILMMGFLGAGNNLHGRYNRFRGCCC
ncbi:MAG: hypothetical protein IJP33_03450 [Firmicutes bacterium]|nr:hypothetical protein [Bacillota bacterium]